MESRAGMIRDTLVSPWYHLVESSGEGFRTDGDYVMISFDWPFLL